MMRSECSLELVILTSLEFLVDIRPIYIGWIPRNGDWSYLSWAWFNIYYGNARAGGDMVETFPSWYTYLTIVFGEWNRSHSRHLLLKLAMKIRMATKLELHLRELSESLYTLLEE